MKKFFFRSLLMVALAAGASLPAWADTIRLKDGSVIRGQIVSFKNEQFTIMVGSGSRGRKSQITVYMEDVDSIDFDSSGNTSNSTAPNNDTANNNQPPYQPPVNNQPANNQPTNTPPTSNAKGSSPIPIEIKIRVRADNTSNGWTNSGFVVRRGQRLHITASGRVTLGKDATGREIFSSPDGLQNRPDRDKLMRNQPTGGLIAVIGDDNDDFIFVGRDHDFVAQRDGVLFLGVNEGNLSDNSGFFEVTIEAEAANPR